MPGGFPTTHHSVLERLRQGSPAERRQSWDALSLVYWKPVYKYLRLRLRLDPEDAEDLVQGFFLRALERGFFDGYDPARGRFRTFLRACLDHFAANARQSERRLKRGGAVAHASLDRDGAERELSTLVAPDDPEMLFEQEWARRLFELAVEDLRAELGRRGKERALELFERYDLEGDGGPRPSYAALATLQGIPVTQVTNELALARRELRRLLLERLAGVTGSDAELRREARVLLAGRP